MRVSTEGLYRVSLDALQTQQSRLATVQNQIASGKRYTAASEAPDAVAAVLRLDQRAAELAQYQHNADQATLSLNLEEQALSDGQNILQRLRELAVQANSSTLSSDDLAAIAQEIRSQGQALMAIANRQDGNGDALFGGSGGETPSFESIAGVVNYLGDATPRRLQIGEGLDIAHSHPGDRVFQRVPEGNGRFVVRPGQNTGPAVVTVQEPAGFDGQSYQLVFDAGNYEVRDASGAVLQSGVATDNLSITVGGLQLDFAGQPADGDEFQIAPARSRSIFTTIESLAAATELGSSGARANAFSSALADLDQAQENFSSIRSEVGSSLRLTQAAQDAAEVTGLQIASTRSSLADVDYAEAASQLALRTSAYEAALQAFSSTQSLSLFNLLR